MQNSVIDPRNAAPTALVDGGPVVRVLRTALPPYDDERCETARPLAGQGLLELTGWQPEAPAWLRLAPTCTPLDQIDDDMLRRTPTADLPPALPQAQRIARGMTEVMAGTRPLVQLTRSTTEEVYRRLARCVQPIAPRAGVPGRAGQVCPPSVRSVRVSHPMDGVVEVVAVIGRRHRVAMIAFRLEGVHGRWRCTELEIG